MKSSILMAATALLAGLLSNAAAQGAPPTTIVVGHLTLQSCNAAYGGYCGHLDRPFDPSGQVPGVVAIGFEYYPSSSTSGDTPTILAEEGGPGSSSTGSRTGYLTLFAPIRNQRNIVIIDKRGTGRSQPVNCKAVQIPFNMTTEIAARCGRELSERSALYGTALAVDDVAAVLRELQTGPVDFYGDSYGTYFGQVLAYRHPDQLRTMVLDSAFPVLGETPWFPTEWTAARNAFELVCERSTSCAKLGGSSLARISALKDSLRHNPVSGSAPGGGTYVGPVTADPGTLYLLMSYAGHWPTPYRELDAAARDYLDKGDSLPLLRLAGEAVNATGFGLGTSVTPFSTGLFVAVTCSDFPLLWNAQSSFSQRWMEYHSAVKGQLASDPKLFSPFSIQDVLEQPNTLIMPWMCLGWPKPPTDHPQGRPVPPDAQFKPVPTLVLSGELDTLTSPAEGALTAALLPGAQQVLVPNLLHETAIADLGIHVTPGGGDLSHCIAPIVLGFVVTRQVGDTSCIHQIPPIRTVPIFAALSADLPPALASAGNMAPEASLRVAAAALETVGDALARYYVAFGYDNAGLRGGTFHFAPTPLGYRFVLTGLQWTQDVAVSGVVNWDQVHGTVEANLDAVQQAGVSGKLHMRWDALAANAVAELDGSLGGKAVVAHRIAP